MVTIYYIIGLFLFFSNLSVIYKWKSHSRIAFWNKTFKNVTGSYPKESDFSSKDEYNHFIGYLGVFIIESIWILIGLLSGSWILMIFLLILNNISSYLIHRYDNVFSKITGFLIFLVKTLTILFIILNKFHLHMDVTNIIKNMI